MIDATKLVHLRDYHVHITDCGWAIAYWSLPLQCFICIGSTPISPSVVTDAIPIPTPEQLAEMWEVIESVASAARSEYVEADATFVFVDVEGRTQDLARKLLESRT